MYSVLIQKLSESEDFSKEFIPWGSPIPVFGNIKDSQIATLGINPSDKEFLDNFGRELDGNYRRFHTLRSLNIDKWSKVKDDHLRLMNDSCNNYFFRNPYGVWFNHLEKILSKTGHSFYSKNNSACHLDLVPYATSTKWANTNKNFKTKALNTFGESFAFSIRSSPIRILILNGKTVVDTLNYLLRNEIEINEMKNWKLPRKNGVGVAGFSYRAKINKIADIKLKRDLIILGFNHNLQSSFGVTNYVKKNISDWIFKETTRVI
ncbi:hypothetical protein K0V43_19670 [Leptospira sp. id769339]|nr:hypothetical protein [Leptospira sp. id769339]